MAREVGLTVEVARAQRGVGSWLLGGAPIGRSAAAAVVAFPAAGRRSVGVPVGALLAACGVVSCLLLLGDTRGAMVGWVGAVLVTVVGVPNAGRRS